MHCIRMGLGHMMSVVRVPKSMPCAPLWRKREKLATAALHHIRHQIRQWPESHFPGIQISSLVLSNQCFPIIFVSPTKTEQM